MKNEVYGLISMVQEQDGTTFKDGTLLFPTKAKADYFLNFVKTIKMPTMKGSRKSHYEEDQSYIVTNFIAENVHRQGNFFVSEIKKHLLSSTNEIPSEDAQISPLLFSQEDNDKSDIEIETKE